MRAWVGRLLLSCACWLVGAELLPRYYCGRGGDELYEGKLAAERALAERVVRHLESHRDLHFFHTGQSRFDGQSAVAIYQMAILGLGQTVLGHPELAQRYVPVMRSAADRLVDPRTLGYAAERYGAHGVVAMAEGRGHAYLGYINLALGMLRAVDPDTPHAALNDRLSEALAQRLFASKHGIIETYPGEWWPPDVAAVAGSIGLHDRVTGKQRRALLAAWERRFRRCAVDASGYLVQRLAAGTCRPIDAPRGSGTAIASYFLGFSNPELSKDLYQSLVEQGKRSLFGFAALSEYAPGHSGVGDGNSGPVVFGVSVGATGFGLAAARVHRDVELFVGLYRTANLFGVSRAVAGGQGFATGGVLGDALLFAMLTARPL